MSRIGEVVETGLRAFVAESFDLHRPPSLGALVRVEEDEGRRVYAVVVDGTTRPVDPGRRVVRRSDEGRFDGQIYNEYPELRHLLRTEFVACLVGYREGAAVRPYLPPAPPRLHYSVWCCDEAEVQAFTDALGYLDVLVAYQGDLPIEQVIAAHLRVVYRMRGRDEDWLRRAAQEVVRLFKHDYDRLMVVLRSVDPQGEE